MVYADIFYVSASTKYCQYKDWLSIHVSEPLCAADQVGVLVGKSFYLNMSGVHMSDVAFAYIERILRPMNRIQLSV